MTTFPYDLQKQKTTEAIRTKKKTLDSEVDRKWREGRRQVGYHLLCIGYWLGKQNGEKSASQRFIFNLYKLVIFKQIYTEYGDTGNQWFPVKGLSPKGPASIEPAPLLLTCSEE